MIGYDTHGPQYPQEWDDIEVEEEAREFILAENYEFTYLSGPKYYAGSVWVSGVTRTGKSLHCTVKLADGRQYKRTIRVREDGDGEYIVIPQDILKNKKVRP